MLPDFLIHKMPWIIVWIDNAIIFYKSMLPFFIIFFVYDWWTWSNHHTLAGLTLPIFLGVISWLVYCGLRHGYAVG